MSAMADLPSNPHLFDSFSAMTFANDISRHYLAATYSRSLHTAAFIPRPRGNSFRHCMVAAITAVLAKRAIKP
jgi:hypothetical protein